MNAPSVLTTSRRRQERSSLRPPPSCARSASPFFWGGISVHADGTVFFACLCLAPHAVLFRCSYSSSGSKNRAPKVATPPLPSLFLPHSSPSQTFQLRLFVRVHFLFSAFTLVVITEMLPCRCCLSAFFYRAASFDIFSAQPHTKHLQQLPRTRAMPPLPPLLPHLQQLALDYEQAVPSAQCVQPQALHSTTSDEGHRSYSPEGRRGASMCTLRC